ncbi:MAG: TonB-dependent receptor [Pseudomonadota bacterium]
METTATIPVEALASEPSSEKTEKQDATKLDTVQVTGSRIKRAEAETAQPVVRLSRKDLERTGSATVGDVLQTLSAAGSSLNTTINNGGTGATEVDLRNLGSNRVLVLVDGHRWINGLRSLSTNSVDLNTIPLAIVDRIDVLQDGASAIYGSDAITGIVNIITRKRFEGASLSSQFGQYSQGDGRQQIHTLSGGKTLNLFGSQSTSAFASFSYQQQQAVFAGDRRISRLPLINTGLTRGSSFTPTTRSLFVGNSSGSTISNFGTDRCPSLSGSVIDGVINSPTPVDLPAEAGGGNVTTLPGAGIPIPDQTGMLPAVNLCDFTLNNGASGNAAADYHRFVPADDAYNFAPANYLSTPLKTYNAYVSLAHDFTDNFRFSLQGLYSKRESTQQLAPQPISLGDIGPIIGGLIPGSTQSFNQATFIPASNPFNPTRSNPGLYPQGPQDIGRLDPRDNSNNENVAAGLFNSGAVLRRMVEGDPRIQQQSVPTRFVRGGFEGGFDLFNSRPINWELGYSYGISTQAQTLLNQYRTDRIRNAIVGNYVETADNTRADQGIPDDVPLCVAPCVPLNFFGGPGTITPEQLAYIQYTDRSSTRSTQSDLYLNFSTTVPLSFLPDELGIAFGVERRTSKYTDRPSQEAIDGTTAGLTSLPSDGSVKAKEAYVELDIPLLKDLALVQDLGLNLAGRVSDYGSLGKSTNGKIGATFHPVRDLLLRSSFSTSFRAPNTGELFLGNAGSFPGLDDPCAAPEAGSVTAANCNADMVPTYTQTVFQFYSPFTGNRDLKSETSHSLTAGFVFSPAAITGFDMSVDYFRIKLDNFIAPPGAQFILDQCYNTSGRQYCQFITRNSQQQLLSVLNAFQNFPSQDTAGFDFSVNYSLPTKNIPALAALGKFKISANATFLSSFAQTVQGSDGVTLTRTGFAGTLTLPRWKINPSLQWSNGPVSASLNTRIIWGSSETCDDGITPSLSSLGLCSDPNNRDADGNLAPRNRVPYSFKTDLQMGYTYKPAKAALTLGVFNLFDRDPPISYSSSNSFESSYWVPGRLTYLNLKKDF